MEIRLATEQDQALITNFGNKMLAHHQTFDDFYKPVAEGVLQQQEPEKIALVAYDEGTPIGFIKGVFYGNPADRSVPFAVLQSVWVEPQARRQGVAGQLVQQFEDVVKGKGAKQIDLHVDVRNTEGLELWSATGYETYQERRRKRL